MVYKNGFESLDSLTAEEKEWIAPLPMKYDKNVTGIERKKTINK